MAADSYHHGALHQAILDAAIDQARSAGPQAVQVRALAKTVGVSPAAIYRHVASIEALLAEVSQIARQRLAVWLIERRAQAPEGGDATTRALARFRAIGRGYIDFALAEPQLFDTAFTPTTTAPPQPDDPSPWEVLVEGVRELVGAGIVAVGGADRAALIAWAGVHGISSILVRGADLGPVSPDDAIDTILDGVLRSLETL